jgi:hypothetical protein
LSTSDLGEEKVAQDRDKQEFVWGFGHDKDTFCPELIWFLENLLKIYIF